MPANTQQIFSVSPNVDSGQNHNAGAILGNSALTTQDGSGTNIYWFWQAGANGSYLQKIIFRSVVSPAATVARIFLCTDTSGSFTGGSTNTTTNTWLIAEVSLPAVTVSQTVQSPTVEVPFGFAIPASYKLLVGFGTATGSGNGWAVTGVGGTY